MTRQQPNDRRSRFREDEAVEVQKTSTPRRSAAPRKPRKTKGKRNG